MPDLYDREKLVVAMVRKVLGGAEGGGVYPLKGSMEGSLWCPEVCVLVSVVVT